jgi:hypothetical protein
VIPARDLGEEVTRHLLDQRIFSSGFPPDSGDSVVLDHDGDSVAFSVMRRGQRLICIEEREANPRTLDLSPEELRLCELNRASFYQVLAVDLGIAPDLAEQARGIWRIGRRTIRDLGRACIYLVEPGFRPTDLELILDRETFKFVCVLGINDMPEAAAVGKSIMTGLVRDHEGKFHSEVFADLLASTAPSSAATYVDLGSMPQKLVICGEEFLMAEHKGQPPIGMKYLEHLFDNVREAIPVWTLYLAANPGLSEVAMVVGQEDEDEEIDEDAVMTGAKRGQKQHVLRPNWEEESTNFKSRKLAMTELSKKREQLEQMISKSAASERTKELQAEIVKLEKYLGIGKHPRNRHRPIKNSDLEMARKSVSNGIDVVIRRVAKQSQDRARNLSESIHQGYEVMFNPPPDWGL